MFAVIVNPVSGDALSYGAKYMYRIYAFMFDMCRSILVDEEESVFLIVPKH